MYSLMKSEPAEFSIDDFVMAPSQITPWVGVRTTRRAISCATAYLGR